MLPRVNNMASCDIYSSSESDSGREFDEESSDSGSDFDQNDSDSDHSFGSDTDSDVDQDTESTLFDLDSQASDIRDADFWSEVVEDIDVPEFVESSGPTHQLPSDANPLQFFMLVFPLALVQILVDNTNLYAAQSVAQGWVDTTIDEMKAFLGLQILMGIIQLPRYTMYWSSNKFMGKLYQDQTLQVLFIFSIFCSLFSLKKYWSVIYVSSVKILKIDHGYGIVFKKLYGIK